MDSSLLCYAMLLLVLYCILTKGPKRPKMTCSIVPIDVPGALTNRGRPKEGPVEGLEQPELQQMPVAPSGRLSGEIKEEKEIEESAESEKTAAEEATERGALGANLKRSPVWIAAQRRVAQARARRETAMNEAAVELQPKDRPKAVTEVEQGPPDALEF